MQATDHQTRPERAKAIGGVAYRLVRDAKIGGFIELEGERKQIWEFTQGSLSIELFAATGRPSRSADFSQLRIPYGTRRVLQIRWDDDDRFKVVHYEPGDWELAPPRVAGGPGLIS